MTSAAASVVCTGIIVLLLRKELEDSTFPCLFIQLLTAIHKAASSFSKDFLRLLGTGCARKGRADFSRGMASFIPQLARAGLCFTYRAASVARSRGGDVFLWSLKALSTGCENLGLRGLGKSSIGFATAALHAWPCVCTCYGLSLRGF